MTDIIKRIHEALERHKDDYARTNDYMDATFSLGADAADLLPEAIEEIKRLEVKLAVAVGTLKRMVKMSIENGGGVVDVVLLDDPCPETLCDFIDAAIAEIK